MSVLMIWEMSIVALRGADDVADNDAVVGVGGDDDDDDGDDDDDDGDKDDDGIGESSSAAFVLTEMLDTVTNCCRIGIIPRLLSSARKVPAEPVGVDWRWKGRDE